MRRLLIRCSVALYLAALVAFAQQPPAELLDYIRNARAAGLTQKDIETNALKAGWPAAVVADALGSSASPSPTQEKTQPAVKSGGSREPAAGAAKGGTDAATPDKSAREPGAKPVEPDSKPAINRGVPDDYVIGAGDILQVSVWKEPDASVPSAVVRPDGKISMPMLKEVEVAGLTPTDVEKRITDQLKTFISAADVTVIVAAINSKRIYVVGGVKKEGPIAYTYRMTILQALSEAGGLTDYAKKKKIYVLRHENGRDYQLPFDYDAALRGERMELNIPLMPGDTLVIPK